MKKLTTRLLVLAALTALGVWLAARAAAPAPETSVRQNALRALAPARPIDRNGPAAPAPESGEVAPVTVDLAVVPTGADDANGLYARWLRGEVDLTENEGLLPPAEMAARRAAALSLRPSAAVQLAPSGLAAAAPGVNAPVVGINFPSIDYNQAGGSVPPDPEMAAGPNHLIAVVNTVLAIYDKTGTQLLAPTDLDSFMTANANCRDTFDPNALYDESADRFIVGADAGGLYYCLAVTTGPNPMGTWRIYAIPTGSAADFFDYPHAGVGRDFIFMGANIFYNSNFGFKESRIWAIEKADLYSGATASYASKALPVIEDTPQPLHLHGWNQGTWPADATHYFFTDTNFNGATYGVWRWTNPVGGTNPTKVGTVNLQSYTGVTAGMPIDAPQSGSSALIQANDYRPHDFEYRDGFAWSAQTIACNPGGGTVNCLRWAKINPATAAIVDAGVYASNGEHRIFGNLAVNACGDMAVGYTKTGSALFPGVYVTGRLAGDPAGALQAETLVRAGAVTYTAFDGSPHRWGDYTGMTIDPDGERFWYLGQYSKNTGNPYGRWATNITSFSYGECGGGETRPSVDVSTKGNGTVSGLSYQAADILHYDGATGAWSLLFDASDVGITANTTAFYREDRTGAPDILYLSFAANQAIPGLGTVAPHDVVKFTPTQLGATTAGAFSLYFDGSDVGLSGSAERIDALGMDGARLLVSMFGAGSVPRAGQTALRFADEDIIAFTPSSTGATTAGAWAAFFDGSTVKGMATEDVSGFWDDPAGGDLYITLDSAFNLSGVKGTVNDVVKLVPAGATYTPSLFWNAKAAGVTPALDALELAP